VCSASNNFLSGGRSRKRSRKRSGGKMAGGSIVNPFVGNTWAANVGRWPGVQGIDGVTNHFKPYNLAKDPNLQSISERDGSIFPQPVWKGGRKRMKGRTGGGGLIPQDLINGGRNIMYGLGSTYNAMAGYAAPVNPLPYKDQLMGTRR
jgi:hypothetical protein